ncbi:hypothetical protein BDK51DRAFT_30725 [Blyttiomyces helicus]|uniref:Uncharacterized protein n=1 Tax=Blyttiomyces helicus TaxID=388810 RepID=A0A4P9WHX0_9FUNG|nr:hypothetical protein BDK51DRAFT_30725 [Blyttiomyces helicus]|eukprot:RKO91565.1 hypothetical protein BDK51DRAFT_30725 [Blyttiomyces helicus]
MCAQGEKGVGNNFALFYRGLRIGRYEVLTKQCQLLEWKDVWGRIGLAIREWGRMDFGGVGSNQLQSLVELESKGPCEMDTSRIACCMMVIAVVVPCGDFVSTWNIVMDGVRNKVDSGRSLSLKEALFADKEAGGDELYRVRLAWRITPVTNYAASWLVEESGISRSFAAVISVGMELYAMRLSFRDESELVDDVSLLLSSLSTKQPQFCCKAVVEGRAVLRDRRRGHERERVVHPWAFDEFEDEEDALQFLQLPHSSATADRWYVVADDEGVALLIPVQWRVLLAETLLLFAGLGVKFYEGICCEVFLFLRCVGWDYHVKYETTAQKVVVEHPWREKEHAELSCLLFCVIWVWDFVVNRDVQLIPKGDTATLLVDAEVCMAKAVVVTVKGKVVVDFERGVVDVSVFKGVQISGIQLKVMQCVDVVNMIPQARGTCHTLTGARMSCDAVGMSVVLRRTRRTSGTHIPLPVPKPAILIGASILSYLAYKFSGVRAAKPIDNCVATEAVWHGCVAFHEEREYSAKDAGVAKRAVIFEVITEEFPEEDLPPELVAGLRVDQLVWGKERAQFDVGGWGSSKQGMGLLAAHVAPLFAEVDGQHDSLGFEEMGADVGREVQMADVPNLRVCLMGFLDVIAGDAVDFFGGLAELVGVLIPEAGLDRAVLPNDVLQEEHEDRALAETFVISIDVQLVFISESTHLSFGLFIDPCVTPVHQRRPPVWDDFLGVRNLGNFF